MFLDQKMSSTAFAWGEDKNLVNFLNMINSGSTLLYRPKKMEKEECTIKIWRS